MALDIASWVFNSFQTLLSLELSLTVWFNSLPSYVLTAAKWASESVYLMMFLIVYFAWKNRSPRRSAYFFASFVASYIFSSFLKLVFNVPRPDVPNPMDVFSSSFPSRHSQLAFTGVALASDSTIRKALPMGAFAAWALLISLSRLVLGVHYLHDIIAGAIFGYLIGQILLKAKKQVKSRLFDLEHYPRKFVIKPEYKLELERKTFHIVGGIIIAILALVLPEILHVPLLSAFLVAMVLISYAAKKKINLSLVNAMIKRMERPANVEEFPLKGAIMELAGVLVAAILFDAKITAAATLVLALGDGFSTMFGILFGVSPLFYNIKKDWEGIFVGIVAAFFGLAFLYPPAIAAIVATIPMLLESMDLRISRYRIDDNLLIPPVAGALLWLLA